MNPINISPKWKVSNTSLRKELHPFPSLPAQLILANTFSVWLWLFNLTYIVLESFFSTQLWNSSLDLSIHNTVRLGWDDKKKHQPTCFQEGARPCGKAKLPKIHWLLPIFTLGICRKHIKLLQPVNIHYSGTFYFIFL